MGGGYRAYLRNVLPRLAAHREVEALLCAAPQSVAVHTWVPPTPKVAYISCAPFRIFRHEPDSTLKAAVECFSPDVIFIPVERYLRFPNVPLVVMVHNMAPFSPVARANPLSEKIRYFAQRYEAKRAIKKAHAIIAPSHFVHDFLMQRWSIPSERVHVVYYGTPLHHTHLIPSIPTLFSLEPARRFFFTAGSIEPYRGLEDIIGALIALKDSGDSVHLVIAGDIRKNMRSYAKRLQQLTYRNGRHLRLHWVGVLSETEMAWCYQHCIAFVMTSRIESFGITALEALSHGCICVAAENPPLPEVFGNAAFFYEPGNTKMLAYLLRMMISQDFKKRLSMQERSKERAKYFSWDTSVEQTLRVFQRCIEQR